MFLYYIIVLVVLLGLQVSGNDDSPLKNQAQQMLRDCCNNITCVLNYNMTERLLSGYVSDCQQPLNHDIDEAILNIDEIKKFYSHMEWSDTGEILQFIAHTLRHLHQKHKEKLETKEQLIASQVWEPFQRSKLNLNHLQKSLSESAKFQNKLSLSSENIPHLNTTYHGGEFLKNLNVAVDSFEHLARHIEELFQNRINHKHFMQSFLERCERRVLETNEMLKKQQEQVERTIELEQNVEKLTENSLIEEENRVYKEAVYCRFFDFVEKTLSFHPTQKCYRMNLYRFNNEKKNNIKTLKTKLTTAKQALNHFNKEKQKLKQELLDTIKMFAIFQFELDRSNKHIKYANEKSHQMNNAVIGTTEMLGELQKVFKNSGVADQLIEPRKLRSLDFEKIGQQMDTFEEEIIAALGNKRATTLNLTEKDNVDKNIIDERK